MMATLLAGAAFAAQPLGQVFAAGGTACATTADGDWSTVANWDCGSAPSDNTYDVTVANDVNLAANTVINDLTVSPTGLLSLTGDLTVNNLDIQPGGILSLADVKTLTVNGNFTIEANGLFDPGIDLGAQSNQGGAVVFGPGSQVVTLNGATVDFWDLTKQTAGGASASESLTFDAGQVHVLNDLTLLGINGFNLHLAAQNSPTQWELNAEGTNVIDYVDVADSNNVTGQVIRVSHFTDSGNNTGWAAEFSTNMAASPNPSVYTSPVTFTVDVPASKNGGTVAFKDGAATISGCGFQPIDENLGQATCTTSALTVGSHTVSAVYSADGSVSGSVAQVVEPFGMISVTSSGSPSLTTDPVTFTARVMPMTALQTVEFNEVDLTQNPPVNTPIAGCTSQAVDPMTGMASCTVTLSQGIHTISADNGKANNDPALISSVPITQNVMVATTLNLAGPNPLLKMYLGVKATFVASVLPAEATGTVTFQSGGSDIPGCVGVALVNGQATCDVTHLAAKLHTVSAIYSGDLTHVGSTSNATSLLVSWWKAFMAIVKSK